MTITTSMIMICVIVHDVDDDYDDGTSDVDDDPSLFIIYSHTLKKAIFGQVVLSYLIVPTDSPGGGALFVRTGV